MRFWRYAMLAILLLPCCRWSSAQNNSGSAIQSGPAIQDVYPDKARYAPHERVVLLVSLADAASRSPFHSAPAHATLQATFWHIETQIAVIAQPITLPGSNPVLVQMHWTPPPQDYVGYLADVRLLASDGRELARSQTAIDVSSEWNRFPRYGYLAHYSRQEGAEPDAWIDYLNKFHIDGLEYYDFQYEHNQPLAGTVEHPAAEWKDIAGRTINRSVIEEFLAAARRHNMMSMATWDTPTAPRTLSTAKSLDLPAGRGWMTPRLVYMNQNSPEWQHFLFGQMAELFRIYPFDGWHIDTFGVNGAYAYDGKYVSFIDGFRPFIDHAREYLHKRVVLNTVNTEGQDQTATSDADFVYSELWDDHETYASILDAAAQVHTVNPQAGLVFAAYLQRPPKDDDPPPVKNFNAPGVLLADAAIFASGADHIELGDGSRMLSSEYFPEDTTFAVSSELTDQLRHYYDFLTAYENVLRYQVAPAAATVTVAGQPSSPYGVPNTIWTIARCKGERTFVHFINLKGSDDAHWRDVHADRAPAPLLTGLKVRVAADDEIAGAGWASPDADGGRYHPLAFTSGSDHGQRYVEFVLPSLRYWDMVVLDHRTSAP
jgi:dextranase